MWAERLARASTHPPSGPGRGARRRGRRGARGAPSAPTVAGAIRSAPGGRAGAPGEGRLDLGGRRLDGLGAAEDAVPDAVAFVLAPGPVLLEGPLGDRGVVPRRRSTAAARGAVGRAALGSGQCAGWPERQRAARWSSSVERSRRIDLPQSRPMVGRGRSSRAPSPASPCPPSTAWPRRRRRSSSRPGWRPTRRPATSSPTCTAGAAGSPGPRSIASGAASASRATR